MPWFWQQNRKSEHEIEPHEPTNARSIWAPFLSPQAITTAAIGVTASFFVVKGYKRYLRRIPNVGYLKPDAFRHRSLYGYVTRVGDGDNFHLFHTPGGLLAGWGWFPGRRLSELKNLKDRTVHVRIAGVDAPECSHFGRPAQPYSTEALEWLRGFVMHRHVRAMPHSRDQFSRVVCTVYRRTPFWFSSDVGLAMLKAGVATVYEAKTGAEFGGKEEEYRAAEVRAKSRKVGMWQEASVVGRIFGVKSGAVETPREYKTRMAKQDMAK